ncbi:MAG: alpha/beta fold hydrolase [Pseudomonadales bacterium]
MISEPTLAVKSRGEGRAIVLLHGLFGSGDNLGMIARGLQAKYRVFSMDLPSHGRSPLLTDMSLSAMAGSVLNTMRAQKIVNPIVIGHSLGGKVAMQLAAMAPEQLAALVVLDIAPVDYAHGHDDVFKAVEALTLDDIKSRSDADLALSQHLPERDVRQFILTNLGKTAEAGYAWKIDFLALKRNYHHFASAPIAGQVFERPVLVVKGAESNYIQNKHEAAFRDRFSDLDFKMIPDTGHWLHAQKTDLLLGMLRRFMEAVPDGLE